MLAVACLFLLKTLVTASNETTTYLQNTTTSLDTTTTSPLNTTTSPQNTTVTASPDDTITSTSIENATISLETTSSSEEFSNFPSASEVREALSAVGRQDWGYVDVRSDAHMFWWLFETTHPDGVNNRPLILWIQGGPGLSGTGIGNFEIIGPLNIDLKYRNETWLQDVSILFVDNPVGAGYSYAETTDSFPTNVHEIAADLLVFLRSFLEMKPIYQDIPLYIFGQSYGGKMTAVFSKTLYQAIQMGEIRCKFEGFAMGNSWISPCDSLVTWGPFVMEMSMIDEMALEMMQRESLKCEESVKEGRWYDARQAFARTASVLHYFSPLLNIYNVLDSFSSKSGRTKRDISIGGSDTPPLFVGDLYDTRLSDFMNGPVREYLNIVPNNVTWGGLMPKVHFKQQDFMAPVYDEVAYMLDNSDLRVVVYQGQLDVICDLRGALNWVNRMNWTLLEAYNTMKRSTLLDEDTGKPAMFVKSYDNFSFYWVLNAGHPVPKDQPGAALRMLRQIINV